jgi:hypothetical protein
VPRFGISYSCARTSSKSPLSDPPHALLDDSAAQFGIDQPLFRSLNSLNQGRFQDSLPSGEPLKPL